MKPVALFQYVANPKSPPVAVFSEYDAEHMRKHADYVEVKVAPADPVVETPAAPANEVPTAPASEAPAAPAVLLRTARRAAKA